MVHLGALYMVATAIALCQSILLPTRDPLANIPLLASTPSDGGKKACAAQNILDNCLSVQGVVFSMCSYSDWACKCQAQKALAGCFNNCPSDDARAAHEGQITVFCNAAKREEEEKSKTITPVSRSSATKHTVGEVATVRRVSRGSSSPSRESRDVSFSNESRASSHHGSAMAAAAAAVALGSLAIMI
ncbi:hypothetical protein GGI25_005030 [Coemansia spiralis]|uniref:Uncharacterized protein n=2 Tax=Coemansia TaxID=4863 RepID=A0A9W8KW39_9FUNG|nr:hypothetical protein EDC05_004821 [Coemansia umbellata]KAJ2620198.1 hypothetical protein GGI26_005214 [Coemansia sp. RSA 1358]KAJ2672658.1 hypothetical protein GGI25_005030 [Coemansia spiralis]